MNPQLDAGRVVRKVFQIYVDQAPVLMPAAAVVFVFSGIVAELLYEAASGLALLAELVALLATTLFTGMVVELVADVQDGRRDAKPSQLLRAVTPVLGQLILVGIVAAIGEALGFILLVVPFFILLTLWSVAAPVVVLERPGVFAALTRSRMLVRGNGWRVFRVVLVLDVLVVVGTFVLVGIAQSGGTGAALVVRVIVGVLSAPLPALGAAVLYFELGGGVPAGSVGARPPAAEPNPFGGA